MDIEDVYTHSIWLQMTQTVNNIRGSPCIIRVDYALQAKWAIVHHNTLYMIVQHQGPYFHMTAVDKDGDIYMSVSLHSLF